MLAVKIYISDMICEFLNFFGPGDLDLWLGSAASIIGESLCTVQQWVVAATSSVTNSQPGSHQSETNSHGHSSRTTSQAAQ